MRPVTAGEYTPGEANFYPRHLCPLGDFPTHRQRLHRNSTILDFTNYPKPIYEMKYPAPGAPGLAKRVKELLQEAGVEGVEEDNSRGLDHGAWVPLILMYPDADIPVGQLSFQTHLDATHHYNIGRALAPLRLDEGVLIIGSGSAIHNHGAPPRPSGVLPWALRFDSWLHDSLVHAWHGRYGDVNEYEKKAPHAKMAHPSPEHFYPLHVALGFAGDSARARLIHRSWEDGHLSYASYRFSASL